MKQVLIIQADGPMEESKSAHLKEKKFVQFVVKIIRCVLRLENFIEKFEVIRGAINGNSIEKFFVYFRFILKKRIVQ